MLERANIDINRKILSDLAVTEPYSFKAVVDTAKSATQKGAGT
jgi:ribosomal protein L20